MGTRVVTAGLSAGVPAAMQLRAVNAIGAGAWSDTKTRTPAAGFAPVNTGRLWANLGNTYKAEIEALLLDVFKTAGRWLGHTAAGYGQGTPLIEAVLDANGYPMRMPAGLSPNSIWTEVLVNQPPEQAALLNGRYRFTYEGAGTLNFFGPGVTNVVRSAGQIEFDYAVVANSAVVLEISAITQGNHPRNMSLYKVSNAALVASGRVTRPDYEWGNVKVGRLMGFLHAPENKTGYPSEGVYSWDWRGAPAVSLAKVINELGIDPWVTIPTWYSDANITDFATKLRDNVNPALKIYVEWANETWNFTSWPYQYCTQQANALWPTSAATDKTYQYAGVRAAQCMNIFSSVFVGQTSRIVRVFGVHTGWPGLEIPSLEAPLWVAQGNPRPVNSFDALAVTGYFNGGLYDDAFQTSLINTLNTSGATAANAALLARIRGPASSEGSLAEMFDQWQYFRGVCNTRRLNLLMYEGGTHILPIGAAADNVAFNNWIISFNYSQTMADLYRQMLIEWDRVGNGGFNAFGTASLPSRYGSWGAMRWMGDTNPRAQVLLAYNNAPL